MPVTWSRIYASDSQPFFVFFPMSSTRSTIVSIFSNLEDEF